MTSVAIFVRQWQSGAIVTQAKILTVYLSEKKFAALCSEVLAWYRFCSVVVAIM